MKKFLRSFVLILLAAAMASTPVAAHYQVTMLNPPIAQSLQAHVGRSLHDAPVELSQMLEMVKSHYKISLMYKSADLKNVMVSNRFDPSLKSVNRQLNNLMRNTSLSYKKISDDFYVIRKRNEPLPVQIQKLNASVAITSGELTENSFRYFEQVVAEHAIAGRVTDQGGQGLPGVSVLLKGTVTGTTTDTDGNYQLSVPDNQSASGVIVFSFIGYMTVEEPINARSAINIILSPDVLQLQEVVVVGYGTQKAESVTGAISSISGRDVAALPVPSVELAMQGRMPGVSVVSNGSPGTEPVVRIRGIGSLSFTTGPLYVVDGFPIQGIANINTQNLLGAFPAIGLNNFDTKDVESIDVLKDASASAIYGSRASNGVVMITTKKGNRDGKLRVNVDSYYGWQSAWNKLDLLNRDEYVQYATALRTNAGNDIPPRFSVMNDPVYPGATRTYAQTETDWQDEMFRTAPMSHTHLSLAGGNEQSRIYTSASYFKQDGIMLGTGYERVSFRMNSDHKVGKRFTFGENLSLSYDERLNENANSGRSQIQHMIREIPYIPVRDPTKQGGFRAPDADDGTDPENPVRIALQDLNQTQGLRLMGNAFAEVEVADWLRYRFTAGVDMLNSEYTLALPIYSDGYNGRPQSILENNRFSNVSTLFTNQLTFDKTFDKHYINAVVVAERQDVLARAVITKAYDDNNDLTQINGGVNPSLNTRRFETLLYSYAGRVNYEYAQKYLFSASFRRDGSSVFAPGRKWGNFPAASIGWRISEEPFLNDNAAISELKVRASYGILGFNGIGAYDWQLVIDRNANAVFNNTPVVGSYLNKLENNDLEWEKTKMWNVGVDLGLLNNSVTFSAEAYNRVVDNLLLQVPISPSLGYTVNPTYNIGEMKNWGYEFQAGYNQYEGNFKWNITGNVGITRNKVLKLATPSATLYAGQFSDYGFDITKTQEGYPIQGFYGWVTDGIFQSLEEVQAAATQNTGTGPGDIRFKDLKKDGVINSDDRTYLGSFIPKFNYGLNFSASYKNFDVTLFLQGVQGNKIYNLNKFYTEGMVRLFNAGSEVRDAWTPSNTDTSVPRAIDGDPNQNVRTSNRFIEDGSYLRLKNLNIGYSLPSKTLLMLTKGSVTSARLYVASQNLLTFTGYSGYDPEIGLRYTGQQVNAPTGNGQLTNGVDYGQFPAARSLMIGIQLGF